MNDNAKDGLAEYREKIRTGEIEKPVRKNPLEKAAEDPTSKTKAIAGKCFDCIYDPASEGNWRTQVKNCTSTECSLWVVRPAR